MRERTSRPRRELRHHSRLFRCHGLAGSHAGDVSGHFIGRELRQREPPGRGAPQAFRVGPHQHQHQRQHEWRRLLLLLLLLRVNGLECTGRDVDSLVQCAHALTTAGVTTVVTSRRHLQLPHCLEVPPLTPDDALQLLRHHAPEVNVTAYADLVKRHCHGLPPLVARMARLVSGHGDFALSPAELSQALADDPGLLVEGLEKEGDMMFKSMSPEIRDHVTQIVQLLGGRFSLELLRAVTGDEEDAPKAKVVVRRLCDEGPLIINTTSQQLCVQPLLVHHIRRMGHMNADDQARFRVMTFLGRVLSHAENKLYLQGQDTIYGHLHGDWPHLEHLLRQAIHCTCNTYPAFLQVALGADRLLVKCYPQEALQFYKDMSVAAVRFGTSHDQAVLQGLMGMAITQGQGTEWEDALRFFDNALSVLQRDRSSIRLLQLLCDTGIAYFRLSRHQEADRYLRQALEVSIDTDVEDERQLEFLLVRIRCFLALPAMFRGYLEESKQLLLETLELCSQVMPHHPDKAILVNSLGLNYERSGENQDLALQYYLQSLAERRQYASVAEGDLVPTLNNVGMQYCRRHNFDLALRFLDEAADIRTRCGRWHYYTALTQQHLGQVCIQRGDFRRAHEHLAEAACVYARCTPGHDVRCKVALCRAHVHITPPCLDVAETRKQLQLVKELADKCGDDLSDSGLMVLLSAVEHSMQLLGWRSRDAISLLTSIRERLSRFDGDTSQQLRDHQNILDEATAVATAPEVAPEQSEILAMHVQDACQMCVSMNECTDVRALWRDAETVVQDKRKVLDRLRSSGTVTRVLRLPAAQQETSGRRSAATAATAESLERRSTISRVPSESVDTSSESSRQSSLTHDGDPSDRLTVPQQETLRDQDQASSLAVLLPKDSSKLWIKEEIDSYVNAVQSPTELQQTHVNPEVVGVWPAVAAGVMQPLNIHAAAPTSFQPHDDVSQALSRAPPLTPEERARSTVLAEQERAMEKLALLEESPPHHDFRPSDSGRTGKMGQTSEIGLRKPTTPAVHGLGNKVGISESCLGEESAGSAGSSSCDAGWARTVAESVRPVKVDKLSDLSSSSSSSSGAVSGRRCIRGIDLVLQDQAEALAHITRQLSSCSSDGVTQAHSQHSSAPLTPYCSDSSSSSSHISAPREPSENDERLDDPNHVCMNVNCKCSFARVRYS
ncbi:hypothetical protein C0Q70_17672 [Pomacea canaliculata]|uniref:Uncharacterized protein n=1 Tax=Pomacea canaliculata TaxID=400727 RepID=A0A2T7NL25_POMCA|nr:uncharacterized protein LOC112575241 isoform X2 [Pomacea canaliculata]PVD21870.1 hypothetical protein C0Q70_17672 [Pomacea canaliculata]